jgi:hypothetical protein
MCAYVLVWLRRHDNPLRPISKFQERKAVAYRWHHFPGGEVKATGQHAAGYSYYYDPPWKMYMQEDQAASYPPPLSRFVDLKRQEELEQRHHFPRGKVKVTGQHAAGYSCYDLRRKMYLQENQAAINN